jgi:hypothetical protein
MRELAFLRVRDCGTDEEHRAVARALGAFGRVLSRGLGTSQDPYAGWFVVRLRSGLPVEDVRKEVDRLGFGGRVDRIEQVECSLEGSVLARQIALPGVA